MPNKPKSIDLLIFCPNCHLQHVDKAEPDVCEICGVSQANHDLVLKKYDHTHETFTAWLNPPHKSHRCHGCNKVFRIADVLTNGVAEIATRGENDTWPEVQDAS